MFVELIKKHLDNYQIVCNVFIDLQNAFDTANHDILYAKIEDYCDHGQASNWF